MQKLSYTSMTIPTASMIAAESCLTRQSFSHPAYISTASSNTFRFPIKATHPTCYFSFGQFLVLTTLNQHSNISLGSFYGCFLLVRRQQVRTGGRSAFLFLSCRSGQSLLDSAQMRTRWCNMPIDLLKSSSWFLETSNTITHFL